MKPLPRKAYFDAPPTAGLPLRLRDLLPGGERNLSTALARFLGVEHVQLESSGTAAMVIALTALKRLSPARTTVIVPAYTCPLVALAVVQCGLELQLCDLKPDSLDLDPLMLKALCNEQTLAVVPTHLCGRISDIDPALECARAVGAWVIEDAAQGLGSRVGGHSIGTRSDIAFFSLAVGKGLTIFEGGALIAREETIRQALRHASQALAHPKPWLEFKRSVELLGYAALYRPAGLRLAYGLPLRRALKKGDWVAAADEYFSLPITLHQVGSWRQAVGVRALKRLPDFLTQQRMQAERRLKRLRTLSGLVPLVGHEGEGSWPVLLVLMPSREARDSVLEALWGNGYGLSIPFVHALPDYHYLNTTLTYKPPVECQEARRLAGRILAISNSPWLSEADFDVVYGVIEEACHAERMTRS